MFLRPPSLRSRLRIIGAVCTVHASQATRPTDVVQEEQNSCRRSKRVDKVRDLFPRWIARGPGQDQVQSLRSGHLGGQWNSLRSQPRSVSEHLFIRPRGSRGLSNKACLAIYETRQTGRLSLCGSVRVTVSLPELREKRICHAAFDKNPSRFMGTTKARYRAPVVRAKGISFI